MFLTLWRKLTNPMSRSFRRGHTRARRRFSCPLELEYLENRLVPATHTWIGAPNGQWSNPNNWIGGTPLGDSTADLDFSEDASAVVNGEVSTVNDLSGLTIRNIFFHNKIYNYIHTGNAITLTGDIWDDGDLSSGLNLIDFDIALSAAPQHNFTCHFSTSPGMGWGIDRPLTSLGPTAVNIWGAGTVGLSGKNTYSGPTYVNDGTLVGYLPSSGAVTVQGGATWHVETNAATGPEAIGSLSGNGNVCLDYYQSNLTVGGDNSSTAWNGVISGTASLIKQGSGTLTLGGLNTFAGGTTIAAGTILEVAQGLPSTGLVTVNSGGTLQLNDCSDSIGSLTGWGNVNLYGSSLFTGNDGTSTTFSGVISGSGTLYKEGAGTFTLSGPIPSGFGRVSARDNLGAIEIDAGTLQLGLTNAIGYGCAVTVEAGPILARARWDLNGHSDAIGSLSGPGGVTLGSANLFTGYDDTTTNFAGGISGTGSLYKEGTGTFTLAGQNLYTGGTFIDDGTLQLGDANALASATAVTVATGAIFDVNGNTDQVKTLTGTGKVTLGNGDLYVGDSSTTIFSGPISGAGTLSKEGSGTLTLTGPNTYANTVIDNGKLLVGVAGAVSSSGAVTVNSSGTFDLNNLNVSIGSLSGTGNVTMGSGSLYVITSISVNANFGGVISGTGSLYKQGAGTLTLSGINTYTGETYVFDGTLLVNGTLDPSGQVEVGSGAELWGSGVVGNVDITSGGLLFPNMNGGDAVLKTGKVWFGSASKFTVRVGQSVKASGTVDLSNGPTLNAQLGQFPAKIGDVYTIIQGAAIIGTFQGLPDGSKVNIGGQVFVIHYTATSVTLTRIS
jgi:autotransporter-associated beta strand protein